MEYPLNIDTSLMAQLLGSPVHELPTFCKERLAQSNRRYRPLTTAERDAHILKVLLRLEEEKIKRTTGENIEAFEQGWRENFELCRTKGVTRERLKPKYVRPYSYIRFQSDYIAPENPYLLDDLLWIAVNWSFDRYFRDVDNVYEFGCGTGQYLFDLAQMFPKKTLFGTDWTESSVMLLELMAKSGMPIKGRCFDMMKPDSSFNIASNSAVVTIGALEQVGQNFTAFLEYLVNQKPEIVVHHEPIEDFYGSGNLIDYIGALFHRRRGYLTGYLGALRVLEQQGKIEIIEAQRVSFGDPFHESCSRIVWKPRNSL